MCKDPTAHAPAVGRNVSYSLSCRLWSSLHTFDAFAKCLASACHLVSMKFYTVTFISQAPPESRYVSSSLAPATQPPEVSTSRTMFHLWTLLLSAPPSNRYQRWSICFLCVGIVLWCFLLKCLIGLGSYRELSVYYQSSGTFTVMISLVLHRW